MYFIKKLTSLGKMNAEEGTFQPEVTTDETALAVAADVAAVPPAIIALGYKPDDGASAGVEDPAGSSDSSGSDPNIPDCFFDDLSETTTTASELQEEAVLPGVAPDDVSKDDATDNAKSSNSNGDDDASMKSAAETAELPDLNTDNEAVVKGDDDGRRSRGEAGTQPLDPSRPITHGEAFISASDVIDVLRGWTVDGLTLDEDASPAMDKPDDSDEYFDYDDDVFSVSGDEPSSDFIRDYLDKENDNAEARLAARRQARVEAREIRLRELERQQKEQEENADRAFDMSYVGDSMLRTGRVTPSAGGITPRDRSMVTTNSYHSSRRSSEDSIDDGLALRDIRHELKEAEEKFKKAMIANAQLDNEKSALSYQIELLKDRYEDLEETHAQLTREHRDKCREHEQLKRAAVKLKEDLEFYKANLLERDSLITEYGLVIVDADETGEGAPKRALVSAQSAELLQQAGCGSLDVRLKKFSEERNELLDEIRHLKLELEEERSKRMSDSKSGHGSLGNGPLDEETSKILSDYKFKLQKAEQDVSTLQANVARLESQVIRYKTAAESSEKAEDELKIEKRKLQRENRESIARIEELETANSHLQRRMDKLKNAKSTLLKEL